MIKYFDQSVFESGCELIVNAVNCLGIMDSGLALEFSLRFPTMYKEYKKDCTDKIIKVGETKMYVDSGQKILNFPTKLDPFKASDIRYIVDGLDYFANHYQDYNIKSIAFPLLGCANGGLDFDTDVKTIMIEQLSNLKIDIVICTNKEISALERKMVDVLKGIDVGKMAADLGLNYLDASFREKIQKIDRLNQLASKKYLKCADDYREIWKYVKIKVEQL